MHTPQGSLQKALNGDYDFAIGAILSEAWNRTDGVKLTFVGSVFVYAVIVVIVTAIFGLIFNIGAYQEAGMETQSILAQVGIDLLTMPIEVPMLAALLMMGIMQVNGKAVKISHLFDYFVYVWPLVFASILIYFFVAIGFMLLILPGIYLSVAYIFVYPLMIDKGLGIWEAMETSRKAVTKRWFLVFGTMLSMVVITLLSALPLGIGLIWTLPMGYLLYGLLYTTVFGFEGAEFSYDNREEDKPL